MMVRDRATTSRTDVATMPPLALNIPHLTGSISKPTSGIFASIIRADSAMPIRPRPTIPTGASALMMRPPCQRLFGFDAGGLGIRGPARDLAGDEGAEFSWRHGGDDHAEAGEPFAHRRRRQDFLGCA